MRFTLPTLFLALAAPLAAQPRVPVQDGKVTIRLTVGAARPPVPLSRVRFLVPYSDQWRGNAVQAFLDCFSEQSLAFTREQEQKREELLQLPISDPRVKAGNVVLRRLHDAAKFDRADWQIRDAFLRDGIGTLLPGEQSMRRLSQVLKVQTRSEIARGEAAAAIVSITDHFALARIFRDHPTAIAYLIGVAIGEQAAATVRELQALPACPNLYWALAQLPRPFFDLRAATEGEAMLARDFQPLVDEVLPESRLAKLVLAFDAFQWSSSDRPELLNVPRLFFALAAADAERVKADRKLLLDSGVEKSLVDAMADLQVVLAADYRQYEIQRDALFAWHGLPYPQLLPGMRAADDAISAKPVKSGLARALLPSLTRVAEAGARLDQRLAVLRLIEALRNHAAETGGFPDLLADCKLPVPADPVSGTAFAYSRDGGVATIRATPTRGGEPGLNFEYVVTLRQ